MMQKPPKSEISNFKSQIPKSLPNKQGIESLAPDIATQSQPQQPIKKNPLQADALELQKKLCRRDRLLTGIANASTALLSQNHYYKKMTKALNIVGEAAIVDRVYIFENNTNPETGEVLASQRFEWSKDSFETQIDNPDLQFAGYDALGMQRWYDVLSQGGSINGPIDDFPESERNFLDQQDIQSLLVVPIIIEGKFWGFAGFDDCTSRREWEQCEESILRTMAASLAESILRQRARAALAAEKKHLAVILRAIVEGVIVTDLEGKITMMNRAAEKLTGWKQAEAKGKVFDSVLQLKHSEKNLKVTIPLLKLIQSGKEMKPHVPVTLIDRNQTKKSVIYKVALLDDSENTTAGTVLMLREFAGRPNP